MTLPSEFIIRRHNDTKLEELYGYVTSKKDDSEKYTFNMIPIFPGKFIKQIQNSYSGLIKNKPYSIKTSRYSKEKCQTLEFETDFWYEGYVVTIHGTNIPIINMFKACQILPGKFVFIEKPIFSEFAVRIQNEVIVKSTTCTIDNYLDTHPNELCPILLTPLEKSSFCLTPCGHGITHSAMLEWLNQKKQCPVCRQDCYASNLIVPMRV